MVRRHVRQGGMAFAGLLAGALLAAVAAYVYFRSVSSLEIAETVLRTIDLPREAFEVEEMEGDSIARISVDDVMIRTAGGDTMIAAPVARFRVRLASLTGEGPIVLDQVRLERAFVNYVQDADGEINLSQAMVVTANGQEIGAGGEGRPIELRDVRLANARVRVLTPYTPDSLGVEPAEGLRLVRAGGTTMRERWARDVDAALPRLRFGGGQGWRVEVGALSATLTDPEVRIANLAGFVSEGEEGSIAFGIEELRTGSSLLVASGTVRFGGEDPVFDVEARAQPLAFADLRWIAPNLPEDGVATGSFAIDGGGGGRFAIAGTGVEVTALDSRLTGFFSAEVGGGQPAVFGATRVSLDPVTIETIRSFGIAAELPYTGEIRGVVASQGGTAGAAQELDLDLVAVVAPESGDVARSTLFLQGPVTVGEEMELRFVGLRAAAQPLHLAALRPLTDADPERLRGVVRGSVVLNGTLQDLRISDGVVAYQVGDAPETTLTALEATVQVEPELRFDVAARAQPIALGTIAELFPGMPFRTARFAGPIRIAGTADRFEVDAQLTGSAGSIAATGVVQPGTPLRFDLSGNVTAFNAEAVITRPVPLEGTVTGSFAVNGTAEAFAFNVDLVQQPSGTQEGGNFALAGTYRAGGGAPALVQVGGDVSNFNLGAVIGRPRLFPSRMSGRIDLTGGGGEAYRFDVDLRGQAGVFDVAGYYVPGDIPTYAASGVITGLDLRQLPGLQMLPATALRGTLELEGQGTSLETLAGELRFSAVGSTVAGTRLDRLELDVAVRDGVLEVQTLDGSLAGTEITAEGRIGLTRPASGNPLQLRVVSRDLGRLAPLAVGTRGLPPRLTGSFILQAELTGSIRAPLVTGAFRGQQLRYEQYRADRLEVTADLAIAEGFEQVQGQLELSGSQLAIPGMSVDSLRFAADGTQDSMAVRMVVSREAGSDIQLAGAVELVGREPRGVLLDSLMLRAGELAWALQTPAMIRWGGVDGVQIANLFLQSTTDPSAGIRVDGSLPPTGPTDLRVEVRSLDLELVRRLVPNAPDIAGLVDLDVLLQGPTSDPELFAQGYATGLRYQGVALDSVSLSADYDERRLVGRASLWQGLLQIATGEAEVPMVLSIEDAVPDFELLRAEPIRAALVADSLPVALLTAGSPEVTDGSGTLAGQLNLGGTVEDPQVDGFATVTNGAVTAPQLGRRFERISGHFILDEQQVLIDSLVVWSGGRAEVNGSVRLTDLERPELYLTSTFDAFHAIDNEQIADLTMSGNVRLEGVMPEPVLTGNVRLQEGAIYIPSLDEQVPLEIADVDVGQVGADTAVAAAVGPSMLERIRISGLDVVVDEGVWLESDEANVQIQGELVVIRNGPDMQLYGTLQALRGTYNLPIGPLYREFDVVSGSVRFLGTPDFNPEIDITAQHEVQAGSAGQGSLAVLVNLTGTLQNPTMQLSSNTRPPLPESELLSYLVFGQPSFRLNQGTGALAQQLVITEFVGGLLSRQLGDLGLPCEYFRLRGRPNILNPTSPFGATSLECGIQVVEDVFLTVESGVLSNLTNSTSSSLGTLLGISLDWQVNNRVTATVGREPVQSALGTMFLSGTEVPYQFSADVTGTWEFGRPAQADLPMPDIRSMPIESGAPATLPPESTTTPDTVTAPAGGAEPEPEPEPPREPVPAPDPVEPVPAPPPRREE